MLNETGVPEIQKAVVILHEMSADEEMQEIARPREKAIRDDASAKDYYRITALTEGREEGRKEGAKKERQETIAKMRKMGMSEEQIKNFYNS